MSESRQLRNEQVTFDPFWKIALLLLAVSIAVNLVIYLIGDSINAFETPVETPQGAQPIPLVAVVFASISLLIPGFIGFYILVKPLNLSISNVRIIAIIVVILSFGLPLTGAGGDILLIIFLILMHIATGIIVISGLTMQTLWNRFS